MTDRDLLIETVARAINRWMPAYSAAEIAVDIVLEEAAMVIENRCHDDMTRSEEASAIRALKSK